MSPPVMLLLDGYSLLARSMRAPNARDRLRQGDEHAPLRGYVGQVLRLIGQYQPARVCLVMDHIEARRGRQALWPDYKARRPTLDPLVADYVERALHLATFLGVPSIHSPNAEAVDVIATLSCSLCALGCRLVVVSHERMLCSLTRPETLLVYREAQEDVVLSPDKAARARFGVRPEQVLDWVSLTGDAFDGIPGVDGIGKKTATALLSVYPDVDRIFAALPGGLPRSKIARVDAVAARLEASGVRERVVLSRQLAQLDAEVPGLRQDLVRRPARQGELRYLLQQWGMADLAERWG